MTGDETLAQLRQTKPDIPALLTSGYNVKNFERKVPTGSHTGYIQKPFRVADLRIKIDDLIHPTAV